MCQGKATSEFFECQSVSEVHLDGAERKLVSRIGILNPLSAGFLAPNTTPLT